MSFLDQLLKGLVLEVLICLNLSLTSEYFISLFQNSTTSVARRLVNRALELDSILLSPPLFWLVQTTNEFRFIKFV